MNFLRTLGIIVISYYVLKFVARLLFPVVVKKAMHNMQERQSPTRENKNEGEVTIETKSDGQKRTRNSEGEYVDFEEIE